MTDRGHWTVVLSAEAADVLQDLRRSDTTQYRAILGQLESLTRLSRDLDPRDLDQALNARFAFKPLRDEAREAGLSQIAIGRGDRYRAALLRIEVSRRMIVIHIYSKNQQDRGIARAIALAGERDDDDR